MTNTQWFLLIGGLLLVMGLTASLLSICRQLRAPEIPWNMPIMWRVTWCSFPPDAIWASA